VEGEGGEEDGASSAKQDLDRYLHYYQRYDNHGKAQTFAIEQRKHTEERMVQLQEQSANMSWADVQFLSDALEVLINCRRVLKYTYVFGYYLPKLTPRRALFEHQQEMLERSTERLSELSEAPFDKIQRVDVINNMRITKQFMTELIEVLSSGMDDVEAPEVPKAAPAEAKED
jgi:ariadne-1